VATLSTAAPAIHSSLVLLTPKAALIGFAFLLPLAALALRERRCARARTLLGVAPPRLRSRAPRPLGLALVAILVAGTAAQPAVRETRSSPMRADVQMELAFDVTRSMLASPAAGSPTRFDRERALAQRIHAALPEVPTGVASVTNRMMPLLFPSDDGRAVPAVIEHALAILQPPPVRMSTPRLTDLSSLALVADRAYFDTRARRHALVVFSDLDSETFSLTGQLALFRRHRIEPFVIRVAARGERVFDASGKPEAYVPASSMTVSALRAAGWHAYEEHEVGRAIAGIREYLGAGPVRESGVTEAQRNLAWLSALAALLVVAAIVAPSLLAGLAGLCDRRPHARRRARAGAASLSVIGSRARHG
jgi:hypothetical protein